VHDERDPPSGHEMRHEQIPPDPEGRQAAVDVSHVGPVTSEATNQAADESPGIQELEREVSASIGPFWSNAFEQKAAGAGGGAISQDACPGRNPACAGWQI
jgi:hypothetical protein